MKLLTYVFWLALIVFGLTFASLNPQQVQVNAYFVTTTVYLPVLLAMALAVGMLFGMLAFFNVWVRMRWANRRLRKQLRKIERTEKDLRRKLNVASSLHGVHHEAPALSQQKKLQA